MWKSLARLGSTWNTFALSRVDVAASIFIIFQYRSSNISMAAITHEGSTPSTKAPTPDSSQFFKRAYQACINCRRRKVKCIIECDKDGLQQPTCVRCKRELRLCAFNADRRTQATSKHSSHGTQRTVQVMEGIELHPSGQTTSLRC